MGPFRVGGTPYPHPIAEEEIIQAGPDGYAPFPAQPGPEYAQHEMMRRAERERRMAAWVAKVPDNDLFGSLGGPNSRMGDWRDLVDAVLTGTITPAAGSGSATAALSPLTAYNTPLWSTQAQSLANPAEAVRILLCVRSVWVLANASNVTGPTPAAPSATGNTGTGSSFTAAQTVNVAIAFVTAAGEGQVSANTLVTIAGNANNVVVTLPAFPANAIGATVYASISSGSATLNRVGTGIASGVSGGTVTITAFPATGIAPQANLPAIPPTGSVYLSLLTTGGDTLPLVATQLGVPQIAYSLSVTGPNALPDIKANQTLLCNSLGVANPGALTVVVGCSLVGVRSGGSE